MKKDVKNSTMVYCENELKKNKKELAKQFSEGCLELEKLLLYCWDNEILTRGCCAGHRTKRYNLIDKTTIGGHGYISFDLNDKEFAKQLSLNILRNDYLKNIKCRKYDEIVVKRSELAIAKWNHHKEGWFGISFYYPNTLSPKISGQVFAQLQTCLESSLTSKLKPENELEKFFCYMIDETFLSTIRDNNIFLDLSTMEFKKNHDFINFKHLYEKRKNKKPANNQFARKLQESQNYEL